MTQDCMMSIFRYAQIWVSCELYIKLLSQLHSGCSATHLFPALRILHERCSFWVSQTSRKAKAVSEMSQQATFSKISFPELLQLAMLAGRWDLYSTLGEPILIFCDKRYKMIQAYTSSSTIITWFLDIFWSMLVLCPIVLSNTLEEIVWSTSLLLSSIQRENLGSRWS